MIPKKAFFEAGRNFWKHWDAPRFLSKWPRNTGLSFVEWPFRTPVWNTMRRHFAPLSSSTSTFSFSAFLRIRWVELVLPSYQLNDYHFSKSKNVKQASLSVIYPLQFLPSLSRAQEREPFIHVLRTPRHFYYQPKQCTLFFFSVFLQWFYPHASCHI